MGEDADLDLPAADGPLDIATAEVVRNALAVADAFGGGAEDPVTVAPGALDRVTVLVQSLEAVARERSRQVLSRTRQPLLDVHNKRGYAVFASVK